MPSRDCQGTVLTSPLRKATRRGALLPLFALTLAPVFAQSDAQKSAENWLGFIDNRRYAESWTEASAYLRRRVSQKKWVDALSSTRSPIGEVKSRKAIRVTKRRSLPGAPDGEYTVIQFLSSFQNKASAVETLTLMKDGGQWRPAGYFIR
jgi:Protein of unknown function (DUF4019)